MQKRERHLRERTVESLAKKFGGITDPGEMVETINDVINCGVPAQDAFKILGRIAYYLPQFGNDSDSLRLVINYEMERLRATDFPSKDGGTWRDYGAATLKYFKDFKKSPQPEIMRAIKETPAPTREMQLEFMQGAVNAWENCDSEFRRSISDYYHAVRLGEITKPETHNRTDANIIELHGMLDWFNQSLFEKGVLAVEKRTKSLNARLNFRTALLKAATDLHKPVPKPEVAH